jgi:hypothetical protein
LRNALKLILSKTELGLVCVISDEVLLVTAEPLLPAKTRVYPVGHLLSVSTPLFENLSPAVAVADRIPEVGDDSVSSAATQLVNAVQTAVTRGEWEDEGGAATISMYGKNLVVRHTPAGHEEIVKLLNMLSKTMQAL